MSRDRRQLRPLISVVLAGIGASMFMFWITARGVSVVSEFPFEMLTFSEDVGQRWLCPKRGFHQNRWRLPEYLEAMMSAGFVNIGYEVMQRDKSTPRDVMPRPDDRFSDMDPDMLSVQVVHMYARKPLQEDSDD